jgi:hypothetical protein
LVLLGDEDRFGSKEGAAGEGHAVFGDLVFHVGF